MKLLERSVEELECTVNVLESEVTFKQIFKIFSVWNLGKEGK